MRNKIKAGLLFVAGLLVGAFASFIILGKISQEMYARSYPKA